jgi:hypothetical protein
MIQVTPTSIPALKARTDTAPGPHKPTPMVCGINMSGLHLFNQLALAKRAGADMTQ